MKSDITKFIALRNALSQERSQIEARLAEVNQALGTGAVQPLAPTVVDPTVAAPTGKRTFSAATKAKMAIAQKARWVKLKGGSPAPVPAPAPTPKPKRRMSAEGRANIIAATKARWAKVNALKAKSAK